MKARRVFANLAIFVGLIGVQTAWGQSGRDSTPPAPTPGKVEAPKAPASAAEAGIGVAVDSRTYVIGAEDVLMLNVWREPDFTRAVVVRPDGKITMPLIGDVVAEGLTPDALGKRIAEALAEFINKPEVTVAVNQVNSKKYFIAGQVNRPGQYPLAVPTRVGDALSAASGFRDFANTKKIVIIRGDQRIKFNWNEYAKGKKLEQNILLENGDTILVQ